MISTEATIRSLPFFASKVISAIVPISGENAILNAIVETADGKYFVKVRDPHRDHYHHVTVRSEFEAIQAVGEAGIGPKAYCCCEEQQCIVMEYLAGPAFDVPGITSDVNLPRAARVIRKLHSLPVRGNLYNFEEVIENYLVELSGQPLLKPEHIDGVRGVLARCRRSASKARIALCHGDLASHNMVESDGIKFIDMEMAGANDLHFDLATFILFNGLNAQQEQRFLSEYGDTRVDLERLADARYAVCARDGLWAISEMVSGKVNEVYPRIAEYCFKVVASMPMDAAPV